MSDYLKPILSPITGCKNRKAWNKTEGKYIPEESGQNLAETDRGSYFNQEEWLEEFLDDKVHFTLRVKVMIVIINMRIMMKIMSSISNLRVFAIVATKLFHQFFHKN